MRIRLILAASVFLLALTGKAFAIECPVLANPTGNLLTNPGIEFCGIDGAGDNAVPFGWQMDESILADAIQTESLAEGAFYGHRRYTGDGGNDIGRYWNMWFKPYVGTFVEVGGVPQEDNYAHLFQDVAAIPGKQYTMTGFAAAEDHFPGGVDNLNWDPNDPGPGPESPDPNNTTDGFPSPTDVFFALEFLDSEDNVLAGSVEIELKENGLVNSTVANWNNAVWKQFTLVGVAPAGTSEVRVRASMLDGVWNPGVDPQSYFVDAFSLTAADPTTPPGDFDFDFDVDGRDFLIWQRGDSPGGGTPAELADWETYYGTDFSGPLSAATAVPEPATAAGLVLGLVCGALGMFRRANRTD